MARVFLVVMDSVGIGGAPDADRFFNGDIPQACAQGRAEEGRTGLLHLPHLCALGLGAAMRLALGQDGKNEAVAGNTDAMTNLGLGAEIKGKWGAASEASPGKDTPTGHWELAGVPVPWAWHYFPDETPAFPTEIVAKVCKLAGADGILGNCHASGTAITAQHGLDHMKTGRPICYTSADSVFQIAAHEQTFGLDRLLNLCQELAPTLHAMKVGRVIARPFVGDGPATFERTTNRKDFAIAPPAPTLCDRVQGGGRPVHAIGKIGDILSMSGIDDVVKGSDAVLMTHLAKAVETAKDGSLTFANFVEFDSLYGHRRDISGYARALEWFDAELGPILKNLRPNDMMIFTADHGNDPSWIGTDHTRERVPVLVAGQGGGELGLLPFVGVAHMAAKHLGIDWT